MIKKLLTTGLFLLLFLIPSAILAADLEITCYSDQKPLIVKNTNPLFQLSGFLPGNSASRTIYMKNSDTENDCRIYFNVSGSTNSLTNKINVQVSGLFNDTLSEYITGERILMADLKPNAEITRSITMDFPADSDNSFTLKQASFDIAVQSEWGPDEDTDGDVEGTTDKDTKKPLLQKLSSLLGIGNEDNQIDPNGTGGGEDRNDTVLGEDTNLNCQDKTLWWVPIIVQLVITLLLLNRKIPGKKHIKLGISLLIGIIAYLIVNKIGCGCNPVWLCTNHWILNTLIAILTVSMYIPSKNTSHTSSQQTFS